MIRTSSAFRHALLFAVLATAVAGLHPGASAQTAADSASSSRADTTPGVLDRVQTANLLPKTVFYKGASATTQGRNSAGVRFASGDLALFTLVDVSGYSSAVQQTYQAYLLTETRLNVGDKILSPGAYGFGFIGGDRLVVMDIGGHELLHATTTRDHQLARPNPLQILPDEAMPGHYRLYLGRSYIILSAAK